MFISDDLYFFISSIITEGIYFYSLFISYKYVILSTTQERGIIFHD